MKLFKKIFATIIAFSAITAVLSQSVSASTNYSNGVSLSNDSISKDGFVLMSENQYKENGYIITDRVYTKENEVSPKSKSGSRTVRHEKDIAADNGDKELLYTFYVSGFFKWNLDNDTVTVSNVTKGYTSYISGTYPKVVSSTTEYKSNQGATFLLGNKYAYAKHILVLQNAFGSQSTYTVYVDVNVRGISTKS
jgi:hypothetical protein